MDNDVLSLLTCTKKRLKPVFFLNQSCNSRHKAKNDTWSIGSSKGNISSLKRP